MLVFGTQMNIVTFCFVCIEIVILLSLIIFQLARPDDKTTILNIILIFLLLVYNITGGLLPDSNLPGSYFIQEAIAYATGFITPCYFPYYVYKVFGLKRLKFHAYKGVFLFLIIPYILFVATFAVTGKPHIAQYLFIFPLLYALWIIILLLKSIQEKYNYKFKTKESKEELTVIILSLAPWMGLPIVSFFDLGQATEASITNFGFLLLFSYQVQRNIKQIRIEHDRLIESEKRLKAWNKDLQAEVKKRTIELEEANRQKITNFINLVHETKTPLTLVKNYLDEYIDKNSSNEELNIIKGGIDKLTYDVINFFDLEKFTKGIDVYKHNKISDFSEILKTNLSLFGYYCTKQNIVLKTSIEEDIFIQADPNAIDRIVNNIVENAVKFTNSGGKIMVTLSRDDGQIRFSVQDDGIGILPSLQKKIFKPYFQIKYKNASLQGMGLGLAIVKKVVDSLGGNIVIESNPHEAPGTTVLIVLKEYDLKTDDTPVLKATETNYSNYPFIDFKIEDTEYSPERRTLLLVEDNMAMLHFLFTKLSGTYNVYCALNGADALKKIYGLPVIPDLILSDVMMDKMDGFSFVKSISEQKNYNHIPIIFLTAKSTPKDRLRGLQLGAVDFVSKPFSFDELRQKIETILLNISRQQTAILNSSISNLRSVKTQKPISGPDSFASLLEQNLKLLNLTNRETEISRLIVQGKTYKEIASELFISEKTVTKHVQNMFGKAGVSNKTGFINKLIQ